MIHLCLHDRWGAAFPKPLTIPKSKADIRQVVRDRTQHNVTPIHILLIKLYLYHPPGFTRQFPNCFCQENKTRQFLLHMMHKIGTRFPSTCFNVDLEFVHETLLEKTQM